MTMRLLSWGSPELARSFVSRWEMSRYSFLSWFENTFVLDSSQGLAYDRRGNSARTTHQWCQKKLDDTTRQTGRRRKWTRHSRRTSLALASMPELRRAIAAHAFLGRRSGDAGRPKYVSTRLRRFEGDRAPCELRRLGLSGRRIGIGSVSGLNSLPCCLCTGTCEGRAF
jgi:hypothetical protein